MFNDLLFAGLNPEQQKAAGTVQGRVLILAGAGSGKTRVLTLRMAHLIKNLNVSPKSILGLTFTNKAAAEMRRRIAELVDSSAATQVTLSTFHSFCMGLLREEAHRLGYTKDFTLYDEKDVQRLVSLIARDILEHESQLPSLAPTLALISDAKNQGKRWEDLKDGTWHDAFSANVYKRLQDSMRAYNAVDFDNLLTLTVELFEKFPEVLEKYRERYRFIMVDEYQDTNQVQFRLIELLSGKHGNLCVVGDDDQSIYGWRGANVKNILNFQADTVIRLEQNYRSTNDILKAANAVISHNKERHPKSLWSCNGDGHLIELFHAPNEVEEAESVVLRIAKLKQEKGLRWKDIAILYRSNALSRQFEVALMHHRWKLGDRWMQGIPYQVFGGAEFYERREVRDLFAYLRVIVNPKDQEAILRVINQPRRGIGESALDALTAYNRKMNVPLWDVLNRVLQEPSYAFLKDAISSKALKGIGNFIETIQEAALRFSKENFCESLKWLVAHIDYEKAIFEEVKSQQMRDFKKENIHEFINILSEYEQKAKQEGVVPSLADFLGAAALDENRAYKDKGKTGSDDKVTLLTFHSAKGLEFPACFLVGLEDHIMPHEKSVREIGIEEERRLMYVALTRAMKFLTISMSKQRKRMGKDSASRPSRFLFDIPKELLRVTDWKHI